MKLKKNLKFGIIGGLTSATLVATTILATSCSTNTTNKVDNQFNPTTTPENSVYHTITFVPGASDVVITGKTKIEVRHENEWWSVKKPAAEKPDHTLDGWEYEKSTDVWETLDDSTKVVGDWTVRPKFTPIEHKFTVVGGNYSITDAIATIAGNDDNAWHLNDNGTPVQDTENVAFTLVKNESTDPQLPAWLSIDDGSHGHDKGKVYWTSSVVATELLKFKVKATYKTKEYFSETIYMHVNAARYEILDGNVSLFGKFGSIGNDNKTWALYKNGVKVTPATAYTLSIYSAEESDLSNHVTLLNNIVNWDASLSVGKHYFVVRCTYEDQTTASATITLDISPVNTKLINGNTLIETTETTTSQETNEWKLSVDGVEQSNVKWELDPVEPTTLPTGLGLVGSSPNYSGVIKYDKVPNGKYKFTIKGTTTDGKYDASETINMIVTASEASITGGVSKVTLDDETVKEFSQEEELFELNVNGSVRSDAEWSLSGLDTALTNHVSIDTLTDTNAGKGQISFSKVPDGSYAFYVVGQVPNTKYKAQTIVSLVSTQATIKITYSCNTAEGEKLDGGDSEIDVSAIKDQNPAANGTKAPTKFVELYKPVPTKPGQYFDKWVYQKAPAALIGQPVSDGATFYEYVESTVAKEDWTIVPTFKTNPVVSITGADYFKATQTQQYSAVSTEPENADPAYTWKVVKWVADETEKQTETPTIDQNGNLTAKNASGLVTIQAFDNVSKVSATKTIIIYYPWQVSTRYWVYDDVTGSGTPGWYSFNDAGATGTGDIPVYALGQEESAPAATLTRSGASGFDKKVWIGDYVTTIPEYFLADCDNFDSPIIFSNNSQCTVIENSFLDNCSKFNQQLILPRNLNTIWDNFMTDCIAFNNTGAAIALDLPSSLRRIGQWFMQGCSSFNQNFTLSANIKRIGNGFLQNCDNMCSTITVNTDVASFESDGDDALSFATDDQTAGGVPMWKTGIALAGDAANINKIKQIFPDLLPTEEQPTLDNYRWLRIS